MNLVPNIINILDSCVFFVSRHKFYIALRHVLITTDLLETTSTWIRRVSKYSCPLYIVLHWGLVWDFSMHMTWSCHLHTHHGNLEKQNTTGIPLGEGLLLLIVKLKENKILRVIIASSLVWRPQQTHVTFYSYNFATISWMNVVLRRSLLCRSCAEEGQAIGARLKPYLHTE